MKKLFFLILLCVSFSFSQTITHYGSSWSDDGADYSFPESSIPDSFTVEDGQCGSVYIGGGAVGITTTNYQFGIPTSATVTGIKIEAKFWAQAGNYDATSSSVYRSHIIYDGSDHYISGDPYCLWQPTNSWVSMGGDGETFGLSLTPEIVNDISFGSNCSWYNDNCDNNGCGTVHVDAIRMTVYYHIPPPKTLYGTTSDLWIEYPIDNSTNADAEDGVFAYSPDANGWGGLLTTFPSFPSFDIPTDATVNGIEVKVKCYSPDQVEGAAVEAILGFYNMGGHFSVNTKPIPTSLGWVTFGSPTDTCTWDAGFSYNLINWLNGLDDNDNPANVGVMFKDIGEGKSLYIDAIKMTVYYTTVGGTTKKQIRVISD